jgi:hypothetical protein
MYAQGLDDIANAIKLGGHQRTMLVEGDMGTGKSSLLWMLDKELASHGAFYFDCTTKTDAGDIGLPQFAKIEEQGFVTYVPNEELGLHLNTPVIIMIDEFGKANKSVKNSLLRLMLERKWGSKELHPDSIVFATTNKGGEGVGDMLLPHERNRICVVRSRKPDNMEWIQWGLNNNIHHTLLGWAKDTPQLFQSYEEVKNPDDNPYIFHPQQQRVAFVTPRSLHACSDWLNIRDQGGISDHTLTSLMMGHIGERGAMDLMAFVNLADQLPRLDDIKNDPMNAKVPTSAAAICMVVFRTLGAIEKDWINAWMDYMNRLDTEAQGMFVNGVRAPKYDKQSMVMTNQKFTKWAMANKHLYSADKV